MKKAAIALVWLMMVGASTAQAAAPSVYGLLEDCRSAEGTVEHSYCLLYLVGFMDGFAASGGGNREICLPKKASISQVRQAFVRWAVGHPQYSGWRPGQGVREALKNAFPCYATPPTYSD